ncbi:hypothetical protein BASA81_001393 [Batrachochytrium salamandrivorans]|nr:hypothetical protein BASA81_001393 [Batrachochytrium salamandrivorans]
METVVPLVRAVVRAFYTDEHAIVVEPLLRDPYYLEDDNQAKGALSRKFGWIASKIIRQRLAALVEHSLVQKKEILVTINLETGDSDMSRHKRDFYYIDFVHFVKVITLRMHMIPQFIFQSKREAVKPEWTCFPDCNQGRIFSLLDVVQFRTNMSTGCFSCPTCGSDLEEREPPAATTATGEQSYEGVDEKFKQQILGEMDFRDGIREYMTQAQHTGTDLPDNDPAKKFKKLELESKRLKLMNLQAERAQEEEDDYRKAATISAGDKVMPSWFKTNAKGELTEDAIQDDKQRKLRNQSARADEQQEPDDYVQNYQQQMMAQAAQAAPPDGGNEDRAQENVQYPVFTFKSGRRVEKRPDMTQDELNALVEACPEDEYENLVAFFFES